MYVSRMPYHVIAGKTAEVEERLRTLKRLINEAGGQNCRIMRATFGSDGGPDVVLEQEAPDLGTLEEQIKAVTSRQEFQDWAREMSPLLVRPPKREAYIIDDAA